MNKRDLVKRLIGHTGIGAAFGYTALHPASLVIHNIYTRDIVSYTASIVSAFYWEHVQMGVYFTFIGAVFGLLNGLSSHRQAILHAEIKRLSITDELTGLFNRRHIMQSIAREVQRAERYGNDLSLIMIDIDHFKQFNDIHGHPAGDQLLRQFSDRLRSTARKTDIVARYGGEEFLILMPNTDIAKAFHLAERIRYDIESYPFDLRESQPAGTVTVSIGCARFDAARQSGVQGIIRAADKCLYRAKNNGRNQICF